MGERIGPAPAGISRPARKWSPGGVLAVVLIGAFALLIARFEWLFPNGLPIGGPQIETGLLSVPSDGWDKATFYSLADLQENERLSAQGRQKGGTTCIQPGDARAALDQVLAKSFAKPDGGRSIWVRVEATRRFGSSTCINAYSSRRSRKSFQTFLRIVKPIEASPLHCSALAFILNRRECPKARPAVPLRIEGPGSYPEAALRAGAEGVAMIEALLDSSHHVLKCTIVTGSGHPELDAKACDIFTANARSFAGKGSSEGLASGVRRIRTRIRWELDKALPVPSPGPEGAASPAKPPERREATHR